ncbi:MAG: hypothetical protein KBA40_03765, partial [Candidatus Peribacteraceae bacterium]|nr:hypothetical protein [Candidatus Peribacteraceae bacterium]
VSHLQFMKLSQNALGGVVTVSVAAVTVLSMIALQYVIPEKKSGLTPRFNEDGTVYSTSRSSTVDMYASVASSVKAGCPEDDQPCLEKAILDMTDSSGPEISIRTLTLLVNEGVMHGRGDYHDYVHRIGRLTAKKEGLNPDGFFRCPVDYNYGCQHGFFEQALVEEPDAVKAAEIVCDTTRMADKPLKFLFYCYHGVGHGVMMAKAYDLDASLEVCDGFADTSQQGGCQQGVFMESVVGHMNGTARQDDVFSEEDRIAPCNRLEARFQYQCYINLGGYLAASGGKGPGAVERATEPCLKADPANIRPCIVSVGLTSTNPGWQQALTPNFTDDPINNAAQICDHFPEGYKDECVDAGIQNLAQFHRDDTTLMVQFCLAVDEEFRSMCFTRIGSIVRDEVPAGTPAEHICAGIPEEYRSLCIQGAKS